MAFKSKATSNIGLVGAPSPVSDTVASGTTHTVVGLSLANTTALNITVSVKLVKSGGSSAFLVKDALVLTGGTLVAVGGDHKVVLEAGDSLTAYSSAASSADAVVSYLV